MARTFFRILPGPDARLEDFLSDRARGRAVRMNDPELERLADGFSAYATLAQARAKARAYPFLGAYIARLEVPDVSALRYERTLPRSRGHHTLSGDAALFLHYVAEVVPV